MNSQEQNDLSFIATSAKDWLDSLINREFKGAKFFWTKDKAREFADVPIETLLFDEYFLNGKKWLFPGIVDTILDIYEQRKTRKVKIVCVAAGFGTGKTEGLGAVLNWLNWYHFSCKFDPNSSNACPQECYGLKPTSKVAFIALSKTLDKSKLITFSAMRSAFNSHFNQEYFPINSRILSRLDIPGNNTMVFPNTATEAANAGWSIFSFVMDEISFLQITDNSSRAMGSSKDVYDQAKEAFDSAEGRMFSRFMYDGMGILISSVNYDEDFLMTKIRKAFRGDISESEVYFKVLLPWKANPGKFNMSKNFYFDTNKFEIIKDEKEIDLLDKYYIEVPIEQIIFGENLNDPNDKLLEDYRNGRIK